MLTAAATALAVVGVNFVIGVAVARALGPANRGIYGEAHFWSQFLASMLSLSVFEALVIRIRADGRAARRFLTLASILSLSVIALILTLGTGIALSDDAVRWLAIDTATRDLAPIILALSAIAVASDAFISIETADLSFKRLNIDRVLSPLLFLACTVTLYALDRATIESLLYCYIASKLPLLIWRMWRFRHSFAHKPDLELAKSVVALGPRIHVANATMRLAQQVDRIAVTTLWAADRAGNYFVAFSACGASLSMASQAINLTLLPTLAGLEGEERRHRVEQLIRMSLILGAAFAIPFWAACPLLIPWVYGDAFREAVSFAQGLIIAMALTPTLSVVNIALRAQARAWPGFEMAIAHLAVFTTGWLFTDFDEPYQLFTCLALANTCCIAAGLRQLGRNKTIAIGRALVPGVADVATLWRVISRYLRKLGSR